LSSSNAKNKTIHNLLRIEMGNFKWQR